jgi:hypothetical protein
MLTQDDITSLECLAERFSDSGKTTLLDLVERMKPLIGQRPLTVWYGSMPESNGKSNFTAVLIRKGASMFDCDEFTIERSEYPDRVAYEADRVRYLIGERAERPCITDYDANKHSGYIPYDHYTCKGKGGEYKLLGQAKGAGLSNGVSVTVYRDVADGQLYYRMPGNFDARMEKLK